MKQTNNRELILSEQFNGFINRITTTKGKDYYSLLSTSDFIELKSVLSNINNIITLRVTHSFADCLLHSGVVNMRQHADIKTDIDSTSANTNGFDVHFTGKVGRADGIVAEVKCNIPVKADRFGAAQLANLEKDVEGLQHGKTKAKGVNTENHLKFLVLLDDGERVHKAAVRFAETMRLRGIQIEVVDNLKPTNLQANTIYVIILKV